jgi:PBP1b-binding outer membrane lipoprotein LpoB
MKKAELIILLIFSLFLAGCSGTYDNQQKFEGAHATQ